MSYKLKYNSSKKRFEWIFELDKVKHSIAFEFSYLSGKRVVFHNSSLIHKSIS